MTTTNSNQLHVTFKLNVEPSVAGTRSAGRPIFIEREVCEIRFAGDRQKVGVFPAHEDEPNATREAGKAGTAWAAYPEGQPITYAMVYNDQYKAFKAGAAQPLSGTPLSEAPFLTEGKRRELKALNVHTIEALAAMDGNPLKQLGMGGREMKNQAQAYLDKAAGSADVTSMAATIASQAAQLAELRGMIDEYVTTPGKTKEQHKVEHDFEKGQALKAEEAAAAKAAADKKLNKEQADWEKKTEKAERGTVMASTDFSKWSDDQLRDYIQAETGQRPRANAAREALMEAANDIRKNAR